MKVLLRLLRVIKPPFHDIPALVDQAPRPEGGVRPRGGPRRAISDGKLAAALRPDGEGVVEAVAPEAVISTARYVALAS